MDDWIEFSLEDFAIVLNEKRVPLSKMQRNDRNGIYPYYGASGIIDYIDDFIFEDEHVLVSEDGENLRSRNTPIAFKADGKFWVNNHAHILKGKKDFHNNLIIYYFQNLNLTPFITGAVQPKLNKGNLLSIPFLLPKDEDEQKAIAEVLSSLDDKIDLLHQQNETLEAMAETMFRQWFVEEAEDDWEEGTLNDFVKVKYGKAHKKLKEGEIPVYGSGGLMRRVDTKLFEGESVLIPRKGTLNNIMYVNEKFWTVDTMFFTEFHSPNRAIFIYQFMKRKDMSRMNVGSAVPSMTREILDNMPILIPPSDLLDKFDLTCKELYTKKEANKNQIKTLKNLRDTLLPKLMSGEVRVKMN